MHFLVCFDIAVIHVGRICSERSWQSTRFLQNSPAKLLTPPKTKQKKSKFSCLEIDRRLARTDITDKDGISLFVGHRSDDEAYSFYRSWQKQRLKTSDTPCSKSCTMWPCHHGWFNPLAAPHDRPQLRNLWSAPRQSGSSRLQPCGRTLSALPVSQAGRSLT